MAAGRPPPALPASPDGVQRHRGPGGGGIEAELPLDADRLQVDRAGSAADENVGADPGADCRLDGRAVIDAAQRAVMIARRRREDGPDETTARGETDIHSKLA